MVLNPNFGHFSPRAADEDVVETLLFENIGNDLLQARDTRPDDIDRLFDIFYGAPERSVDELLAGLGI